jgi:hypothetical protein
MKIATAVHIFPNEWPDFSLSLPPLASFHVAFLSPCCCLTWPVSPYSQSVLTFHTYTSAVNKCLNSCDCWSIDWMSVGLIGVKVWGIHFEILEWIWSALFWVNIKTGWLEHFITGVFFNSLSWSQWQHPKVCYKSKFYVTDIIIVVWCSFRLLRRIFLRMSILTYVSLCICGMHLTVTVWSPNCSFILWCISTARMLGLLCLSLIPIRHPFHCLFHTVASMAVLGQNVSWQYTIIPSTCCWARCWIFFTAEGLHFYYMLKLLVV